LVESAFTSKPDALWFSRVLHIILYGTVVFHCPENGTSK